MWTLGVRTFRVWSTSTVRRAAQSAAALAVVGSTVLGGPTAAQATALGNYGCDTSVGLGRLNPADRVALGWMTAPSFPAYKVGVGSNVTWTLDPYRHATWRLWLHSLQWSRRMIDTYDKTRERVWLDRSVALAQDWLHDNSMSHPSTAASSATSHRTSYLVCLHEYAGNAAWLVRAMTAHAAYLAAHYSGPWNHGMDESLAMLGVGCELGRRDYRDLAASRLRAMASVVVDAQGATNEQSVGYAGYVYRRLVHVLDVMAACGAPAPSWLAGRVARMPAFLAHASQPDGAFAQLGDTGDVGIWPMPGTAAEYPGSGGVSGVPPRQRVGVYGAGYVFGRSEWTPLRTASHYVLRFGPPRAIHGHRDKTSLLWFAHGRRVLTDGGNIGYENSWRRDYDLSPAAHNVVLIPGAPTGSDRARLLRSALTPRADFYEVHDTTYVNRPRARSVLVLRDPEALVVLDRAWSADSRRFQQVWHLPADVSTSRPSRCCVSGTPASGGRRTVLVQVPLPGQALGPGATLVVRGARSPAQGWTSPSEGRWLPSPAVVMTRSGRSLLLLTVVTTSAPGGRVTATARPSADGWYALTVTVDGRSAVVDVSPGGYLGRVR